MSVGPLCRFGVDVESNTLYGSIHHSIGDGRSIQILLDAINVGTVKASTSEWSIRKYAAFEALPEVVNDQRALVEKYVELLGDTPPRLEVDFASPPPSSSASTSTSASTSSAYQRTTSRSGISLDCATRMSLEKYCRKEKISLFSLALGVMHKAIRSYSHEAFAIGTSYDARPSCFRDSVGMFVNTVLVPFGNCEENSKEETLKELHDRWTNSILPLATAPFDMISAAGYGCNVFLAFNVGIFSSERDDSSRRMKSLPKPRLRDQNGSDSSFSMEWEDFAGDGSINVTFESCMGHFPGIEERFQYIISQFLRTLP